MLRGILMWSGMLLLAMTSTVKAAADKELDCSKVIESLSVPVKEKFKTDLKQADLNGSQTVIIKSVE